MDQTLSLRLGCYAWLLSGKLAFRWASNRERAYDQLREDGLVSYATARECYYIGQYGTVAAAERAADDLRDNSILIY